MKYAVNSESRQTHAGRQFSVRAYASEFEQEISMHVRALDAARLLVGRRFAESLGLQTGDVQWCRGSFRGLDGNEIPASIVESSPNVLTIAADLSARVGSESCPHFVQFSFGATITPEGIKVSIIAYGSDQPFVIVVNEGADHMKLLVQMDEFFVSKAKIQVDTFYANYFRPARND